MLVCSVRVLSRTWAHTRSSWVEIYGNLMDKVPVFFVFVCGEKMIQRKIRALCDFTFRSMFEDGKILTAGQVCTLTFKNEKMFAEHLALRPQRFEEVDEYVAEALPEIPVLPLHSTEEEVEEFLVGEDSSLDLTGNLDKIEEERNGRL